jgi:hypothetical protein
MRLHIPGASQVGLRRRARLLCRHHPTRSHPRQNRNCTWEREREQMLGQVQQVRVKVGRKPATWCEHDQGTFDDGDLVSAATVD